MSHSFRTPKHGRCLRALYKIKQQGDSARVACLAMLLNFQALQQALTAAGEARAAVLLPPGVYRTDRTLTVPEGATARPVWL